MKTVYAPGTVAEIGWVMTGGRERALWNSRDWATESGIAVHPDRVTDVRPLVVIDPEDREQVERLRDMWDDAHEDQQGHRPSQSARGARGNTLQAALREFANPKPPKPAEPTGLGAVVEDAEGGSWVRLTSPPEWISDDGISLAYSDIDAVKVLSEGVVAP